MLQVLNFGIDVHDNKLTCKRKCLLTVGTRAPSVTGNFHYAGTMPRTNGHFLRLARMLDYYTARGEALDPTAGILIHFSSI